MKTVSLGVRSLVRMLSFACVVTATACGGDEKRLPTSPSSPPPSGGGTTVTGAERIGWSQVIPTQQNIQQFRFVAFIDSRSRVNLGNVQCGSNVRGIAECSASLPPMSAGRHTLRLAALDPSGMESAQSDALVLDVVTQVSSD